MVALALTHTILLSFQITDEKHIYTADQHQDRAESTGNGFDLLTQLHQLHLCASIGSRPLRKCHIL